VRYAKKLAATSAPATLPLGRGCAGTDGDGTAKLSEGAVPSHGSHAGALARNKESRFLSRLVAEQCPA
jgi:hypothetical protein